MEADREVGAEIARLRRRTRVAVKACQEFIEAWYARRWDPVSCLELPRPLSKPVGGESDG